MHLPTRWLGFWALHATADIHMLHDFGLGRCCFSQRHPPTLLYPATRRLGFTDVCRRLCAKGAFATFVVCRPLGTCL